MSAAYRSLIPTPHTVASGAAQFFEREFELPSGRLRAAASAAQGQPYTQALRYAFPGAPGGRAPTYDELEKAAAANPKFAPTWAELKSEMDASVQRGATTDDDAAYVARTKLERDIRTAMAPLVEAENRKRSIATVPTRSGLASNQPTGGLPPIDLEQVVQEQMKRQVIPGVHVPPLSKEDVAAAGWAFLQQQGAEEQAKLPFAAQKILGGAGKGVQLAAGMVPAGRAAAGLGLIGKALVEGAAASTVEQGLGIAAGTQDSFSTKKLASDAATMGIGGAAGKGLGAAFPAAKRIAEPLGTLGTLEVAGAAASSGEGGKASWKDVAGHILESATTIGVAGAFGAGRQSREMPRTAERPAVAETLSAKMRGEQAFNPTTLEAKPAEPPKTDYETAKAVGSALGDRLRRVFGMSPKGTDYQDRINAEFLPREMEQRAAADALQKAVEKAAPRDPKTQEQIRLALQRVVENPSVADKIPNKPANFDELVGLMKAAGASNLAAGELMGKYGLYGSSFDIDPTTLQVRPTGGLEYHKARGHYVPENVKGKPLVPRGAGEPPGTNKVGPPQQGFRRLFRGVGQNTGSGKSNHGAYFTDNPRRAEKWGKVYFVDVPNSDIQPGGRMTPRATGSNFNDYTTRDPAFLAGLRPLISGNTGEPPGTPTTREAGFSGPTDPRAPLSSEKVRGHLQRRTMSLEEKIEKGYPIDASHGAMMAVVADEFGGARKAARLRLAEADGKLTDEAKPGYVRLEGKEWGADEGRYLDPSVFRTASIERAQRGPVSQLFNTLVSKSKRAMVVYTPAGWLRDTVGNMRKATQLGLPLWPYLAEKARAIKPAYGENARDPIDAALFSLKRHANMGSSADVSAEDSPGLAKARSRYEKAKETRHGVWSTGATVLLEKAAQKIGTFPGVRQVPHIRNSLVDESDMVAAFRTAVKYGIDDSGPMGYQQAFDAVVRPIWDYGTLPRAVQNVTPFLTYLRWRAKTFQSLGAAAYAKPSVFGFKVPEPFTKVMRDNPPESGKAQAALVARGMMRVSLHAAEWIGPMVGLQHAQLANIGKTKEELDQALDKKYRFLPDSIRWLVKQTYIPYSYSGGSFDGVDGSSFVPELEALRYFLLASDAPIEWQAGEKNVLYGMASEISANKDFFGHNVSHGTKGERAIGALRAVGSRFVPGERTAESILGELELPEEERNVLRAVLRNVVGIPLVKADEPGTYDKQIEDWLDRGVIGWETRDDGGANLYVRDPSSPDEISEAKKAEAYLKVNKYTSEAALNRYLRQRIEGRFERAGLR